MRRIVYNDSRCCALGVMDIGAVLGGLIVCVSIGSGVLFGLLLIVLGGLNAVAFLSGWLERE